VSKATVMAGWSDVPHIPEEEQARLLAATPPHLRDARSKGIPRVGAGAIYPFESEAITVPDFDISPHWPRGYGFDVGWRATAAIWGAWDRLSDVIYLYREYKRGEAEPAVHVAAIRNGGAQMIGASDPAARNRSSKDGTRLWDSYADLGLDLIPAENAVEAGLFECWERFSSGRLKVFASLAKTLAELRLYRRDDKGRVVKENDHLMDCMRYLVMTREDALVWHPGQSDRTEVVGTASRRYA
jgi:hypothetical protein